MFVGVGLLIMGRVELTCLLLILIPLSFFFPISSSGLLLHSLLPLMLIFVISFHLISSVFFSFLVTVLILQNTKGEFYGICPHGHFS